MTSLLTAPLGNGPVAIGGALEIEHTQHGLLPHRAPWSLRLGLLIGGTVANLRYGFHLDRGA
jgi:hypothetical protein